MPTGVKIPHVIDLCNGRRKDTGAKLYTVLEQRKERIASSTLMGTAHT